MRHVLPIALVFLAGIATQGQEFQEGTWSGTLTRANTDNPRPQRQKFALEFKKAPDPHWAWRPGAGETWNVTAIAPQGRAQAMNLKVEGDTFSFAFRREDGLMACSLTRQPDATFQGDCIGEADTSVFRLTLTPPAPPAAK